MKHVRQPWAPKFSKNEQEWMDAYDHVQQGLDQMGEQAERFTPERKTACVNALRLALDILAPPPPIQSTVKAVTRRKPMLPIQLAAGAPRGPDDQGCDSDPMGTVLRLLEAHRQTIDASVPNSLALAPLEIAIAQLAGAKS